jgi:hypothetical protein
VNGYTLAAVIALCVTTLLLALIWAAVRINQTKR